MATAFLGPELWGCAPSLSPSEKGPGASHCRRVGASDLLENPKNLDSTAVLPTFKSKRFPIVPNNF